MRAVLAKHDLVMFTGESTPEAEKEKAEELLKRVVFRQAAQAADLPDEDLETLGHAGYFDEWRAGVAYVAGKRLTHQGATYVVMQNVTSQAHQSPGSAGMLAIYRPVAAASPGGEEQGTIGNPIPFVYGMDVTTGQYVSYEGGLWLAKGDMKPCVWIPGTAGMWQWEKVTVAAASGAPAALYRLNSAGTLYHTLTCSYGSETAEQLSLADIAAQHPGANPCGRCNPPDTI